MGCRFGVDFFQSIEVITCSKKGLVVTSSGLKASSSRDTQFLKAHSSRESSVLIVSDRVIVCQGGLKRSDSSLVSKPYFHLHSERLLAKSE